MTPEEKLLFEELTASRREFSRYVLKSYAGRGIQKSVVDKYSAQAHFIYELLQNADDAGATVVRFEVRADRLFFHHNGTRHFTLTEPAKENEDAKKGKVGDINAITAIGGSNKGGCELGNGVARFLQPKYA